MSKQAITEQAIVSKRRWWLALLSLLAGAGYLYVGRPIRFFLWLLLNCLAIALLFLGPSNLMSTPSVFVAMAALAITVSFAMVVDVVRLAIGQPEYQLQWYNRWWAYLASFMVWTAVGFVPETVGREAMAVRTYSIPAASNIPTLLVGDYVTGDPSAYSDSYPQRGDVVVFKLPRDNKTDFVKRIIGLPGDRVQMVDGVLHINSVAVQHRQIGMYEHRAASKARVFEETLPNGVTYKTLDIYAGAADNTQEYVVPSGHYFVLGDNRDNSTDSRFLKEVGYVPRQNIYVKVGGVYYSPDWSRIGSIVR